MNQIHKADVIVVLGAAVNPGGTPSPTLQRRVFHAIRLYHRGFSGSFIFTGGIGRYPPSEAEVMLRLALENDLPKDRILLEETAASTLDSAIACSRIIRKNGWSTTAIVMDRYHLFRSVFLFRKLGIEAVGSAPKRINPPIGPWRLRYMIVREWIALPWSLIRLYARRIFGNIQ